MAGAIYRLPFEDDGEWSVAQSSWDDSSGADYDATNEKRRGLEDI
jgi:hypothetical protein